MKELFDLPFDRILVEREGKKTKYTLVHGSQTVMITTDTGVDIVVVSIFDGNERLLSDLFSYDQLVPRLKHYLSEQEHD